MSVCGGRERGRAVEFPADQQAAVGVVADNQPGAVLAVGARDGLDGDAVGDQRGVEGLEVALLAALDPLVDAERTPGAAGILKTPGDHAGFLDPEGTGAAILERAR
jgi:hypothetical protein